jgi:hypothetical protein
MENPLTQGAEGRPAAVKAFVSGFIAGVGVILLETLATAAAPEGFPGLGGEVHWLGALLAPAAAAAVAAIRMGAPGRRAIPLALFGAVAGFSLSLLAEYIGLLIQFVNLYDGTPGAWAELEHTGWWRGSVHLFFIIPLLALLGVLFGRRGLGSGHICRQ